jgi:hypothetical protein
MIQSKHGRLKAIHYLKQAHEHVSLVMELPNTAVQPIRVPWRRKKLCKINKLEPVTRDNPD